MGWRERWVGGRRQVGRWCRERRIDGMRRVGRWGGEIDG